MVWGRVAWGTLILTPTVGTSMLARVTERAPTDVAPDATDDDARSRAALRRGGLQQTQGRAVIGDPLEMSGISGRCEALQHHA